MPGLGLANFFIDYIKLKTRYMPKSHSQTRTLMLSAVLLIIPLLFWVLWIMAFVNTPGGSQQEKLAAFYAYLPEFIQDQLTISLVVLAFSLLAVVFASIGIQRSTGSSKLVGVLFITIGLLFLLLQIFTMM